MSRGRWSHSAPASVSVRERAGGVCFPLVRFEDAIYCRPFRPRALWSIGRHLPPYVQPFALNRCGSGAVRRVATAGHSQVSRGSTADLSQVALRAMPDCRMPHFMSVGFVTRRLSCSTDCRTLHFVRWVSVTYFSSCGMLVPHIDTCVVILRSTIRNNE